MATQQNVIKKFMASLDTTSKSGSSAVDAAIKASTNFKNTKAVTKKLISDLKSTTADDFLKTYCGIDFSNTDTGAITGSDAGGTTTKTAESIVPESGSLNDFTEDSFIKNGLTFKLAKSYKNLSAKEQFIWKALNTWWAEKSLDLINESYGYSFKDSDVTFKEVTVNFVNNSSTTLLAWNHWYSDYTGKVYKVELNINMRYYNNIDVTNPNGKSTSTKFYLDRTLAHELTHTVMHAKINNSTALPHFISEGMAELTHGIDDERTSDISYLAKNSSVLSKWLDPTYNPGSSSADYSYESGYIFLRYLARQSGDLTLNNTSNKTTLKTFDGSDTIFSSGSNVTIDSSAGNDSIGAYGSNLSINGGAGNNYAYLYGGASNVTMKTGSGKDSLHSVAQGATISSGSGDDYIYLYANASKNKVSTSSGNDSILSAAQVATITAGAGNDSIYLYNNSAKNSVDGGAGNDSIFSGGASASILGGDDDDYIHLYTQATKNTVKAGAGDDTIKSYSTSTNYLYGGAGNDSINSGAGADKLYGQDGADALLGGDGDDTLSGGDGNDLLWGGAGTDKLYGGDGDDVFVYQPGGGKDYIYDWESGDMLMILKADGSGGGTYTKSSFKSGTLTLTIDGGGKVIFKDVGSSDTFNINGTTHRISGSKLK